MTLRVSKFCGFVIFQFWDFKEHGMAAIEKQFLSNNEQLVEQFQ